MSQPEMHQPSTAGSPASATNAQRTRALIFATLGFTVTFWAWSLISPLGPHFVAEGLTDDSALLVAVPVLVGSLGRIVVGALTDRLGGRFMMSFIALITVIPALFVGFIGQYNYATLIVGGFFLGVAGTSFAVGVPYVNRWFPKESRGSAIGVYGMGMGGTAIAAFTTVPLYNIWPQLPFVVAAVVLVIYALLAFTLMRNPPDWQPVRQSLITTLGQTLSVKLTWQAAYLYALAFGGYVAFSVYLPTYLNNDYGLEPADASLRMAGFVIVAVITRPLGGILADRLGAVKTSAWPTHSSPSAPSPCPSTPWSSSSTAQSSLRCRQASEWPPVRPSRSSRSARILQGSARSRASSALPADWRDCPAAPAGSDVVGDPRLLAGSAAARRLHGHRAPHHTLDRRQPADDGRSRGPS